LKIENGRYLFLGRSDKFAQHFDKQAKGHQARGLGYQRKKRGRIRGEETWGELRTETQWQVWRLRWRGVKRWQALGRLWTTYATGGWGARLIWVVSKQKSVESRAVLKTSKQAEKKKESKKEAL